MTPTPHARVAPTLEFAWTAGPPLLRTPPLGVEDWIAIKDPSVIRHGGRWHLFCTVRGRERSHDIVHLSFEDFADAQKRTPVSLPIHDGYFCAPQVFYFAPQDRWYLICQAIDQSWAPPFQGAYATTQTPGDPASWTRLQPLNIQRPEDVKKPYLDYWVICDDTHAYAFFTSNNGKLWRTRTKLADFPAGWSFPQLALEDDIFEASHLYTLTDRPGYLLLIEAQADNDRRYFRGFHADRLDGVWTPVGPDAAGLYASTANVEQPEGHWTDSISHGELLRDANDQTLPAKLHAPFVFQGVLAADRDGKDYGSIPWSLGILEPR